MSLERNIEKFWYPSSSRTASLFVFVMWPLHFVLLIFVQIKRFLYTSKIITSKRFRKPVIVVGNISVGGTGKTPFITELVNILSEKGIKVGLISRGYKAKNASFPHLVSSSDTASNIGDEAFMQFQKLGIPSVIDPNRRRGINYLIDKVDIDLVISDDGLQHYRMYRDLEFVLFDGMRRFGNEKLLPIGPLREPVSRLKSVDLVLANGKADNAAKNLSVEIKSARFVNLLTKEFFELSSFSNKQVNAIVGIGNPNRFLSSLAEHCDIVTSRVFDDHHDYTLNDFSDFEDDIVVMTEKDAVKCFSFAKENWYYLEVSMTFNEAVKERLTLLIEPIIKKMRD